MVKTPPSNSEDILLQTKDSNGMPLPNGGIRIMQAMRRLLEKKNFNSVTTAEISREAGVNEALIYRYFKDKRGLLHKILAEYFRTHLCQIEIDVSQTSGSINELKTLIDGTVEFHRKNQVFSRILLLEVRNHPAYFDSEAYELAKKYSRLINEIIIKGMDDGEFRRDIPLACMRDIIIGSIERACMRPAVFYRDFDAQISGNVLSEAIIEGLQTERRHRTRQKS